MDKFVLWAVQFYPFTLLVVLCAGRERICDSAPLSSDVSQRGKYWNENDRGSEARFVVECFIYWKVQIWAK